MEQKEKKKKSSFWVLIAVVTSVIKLFDNEDGLYVVIFLVFIGIIFWVLKKAVQKTNRNCQAQQSEMQGYESDTPSLAAQLSQQRPQDFRARANEHNQVKKQHVYQPNQLNGRVQELKDLLDAGIIEREEYNDRMAEIQARM